jgi:hypothetical protein
MAVPMERTAATARLSIVLHIIPRYRSRTRLAAQAAAGAQSVVSCPADCTDGTRYFINNETHLLRYQALPIHSHDFKIEGSRSAGKIITEMSTNERVYGLGESGTLGDLSTLRRNLAGHVLTSLLST